MPTTSLPFGTLLKQLRKQAGMTQRDLAAALNYSDSLISGLEKEQRLPDLTFVIERLIPALGLQDNPQTAARLVECAAAARGERPPATLTVQRTTQLVVSETFTLPSSRLPAPPTELIGREQAIKTLCNRLQGHSGRLLTLTGPPGVGKTRLALAVADRLEALFKDGARFVPLAAVTDPELVATTIANALELPGQQAPDKRLLQGLRHKELLLVLDNFEQILAAAPLLATLLAECPRLYLLVTSRERLHLRAEQRFPVPLLDLASGVALFVQCAQRIDPTFALTPDNQSALEKLCQRLDGLPLAIELMATHVDLFSPQQLLTRLQGRWLDLLTDNYQDAPAHQRTLRGAIQASYAMLGPDEQLLFRTLGIFSGGFDLEAVRGLGFSEQTLQTLVNRSLVRIEVHRSGTSRGLLLETLREYAREQLIARQEFQPVQQQHADYFLSCVESHHHLFTRHGQLTWLSSTERNLENIRVAVDFLIEQRNVDKALQLLIASQPFWSDIEYQPTMLPQYQAAIRLADEEWAIGPAQLSGQLDPHAWRRIDLLAHALACAGKAALSFPWDVQVATALFQRAALLDRMTGIKQVTLFILFGFAFAARFTQQYERMAELCNEVLDLLPAVVDIHELHRKQIKLLALQGLSVCAMDRNDTAQLEALSDQMLPLLQELDDQERLVNVLLNQGDVALYNGEISRAGEFLQRSLTHTTRKDTFDANWLSYKLGIVAFHKGDLQEAQTRFVDFIRYLHTNYGFWNVSYGLWGLADLALAQGRSNVAAQLLGAADHLRQLTPDLFPPFFHRAYAATIAAVRASLGETPYASAYAEGYAMTTDQAVAFALAQFDAKQQILTSQ